MRNTVEYVLLNSVTPKTITSSTDANPIVITKASHGLATGDLILIYGHTTNIAANGIRKVTVVSSSTFSLQDPYTGANIAGSGAGAGGASGFFCTAPKIPLTSDFRNASLAINSADTATMTLKVAVSNGKNLVDEGNYGDMPNFGATVTDTNPYTFAAVVNLEDGAQVEGDTGIAFTGTDFFRNFEVNTNLQKWLTVFPTAWTQGAITVKVILSDNG